MGNDGRKDMYVRVCKLCVADVSELGFERVLVRDRSDCEEMLVYARRVRLHVKHGQAMGAGNQMKDVDVRKKEGKSSTK